MSATPSLALLERAACELALAGNQTTADELRDFRLQYAAAVDAIDDKVAELDRATHGLADTPADRALRDSLNELRPLSCPK